MKNTNPQPEQTTPKALDDELLNAATGGTLAGVGFTPTHDLDDGFIGNLVGEDENP